MAVGDERCGEAAVPSHKPCKELTWFCHPYVNAPLRTAVVIKDRPRLTQVQDPGQNGYGTTRVQLISVRELDVAVSVPEELGCCVRPSVGAWACSDANESTSWVLVSADITALVLFIQWIYGNDTR